MIANVTLDGHILSMPVNLHRENALFYNTKIFSLMGMQPPRTLADLLRTCKELKERVQRHEACPDFWFLCLTS